MEGHNCNCDQILDEFNEHVREVEGHVKRAEVLKERARSTAQLVSFTFYYPTYRARNDGI
jgi:hypothetical protein